MSNPLEHATRRKDVRPADKKTNMNTLKHVLLQHPAQPCLTYSRHECDQALAWQIQRMTGSLTKTGNDSC